MVPKPPIVVNLQKIKRYHTASEYLLVHKDQNMKVSGRWAHDTEITRLKLIVKVSHILAQCKMICTMDRDKLRGLTVLNILVSIRVDPLMGKVFISMLMVLSMWELLRMALEMDMVLIL